MSALISAQRTRMHSIAARASMAGCSAFVALLVALHFVKPEIEPSWRFISEYALGAHGWLMATAFLALALACAALAWTLRPHLRSGAGRAGLALLWVSALGLSMAGLFTTDPITTAEDASTSSGRLHSVGGMLGLAMPIAVALVTWSLRREPAWAAHRSAIMATALLALAGFLVSIVWIGASLSQSGGTFGPDAHVGWANRFEIVAYCTWLMAVSRAAARRAADAV